jgi:zinc transporter ZupT
LIKAKKEKKVSVMLGFQNSTIIEGSIDKLDRLYQAGTRWMQLTYNECNLLGIALFCALASVAGFSLFTYTPDNWLAFIQAFAGGAILMMLANSMIPEAFEHGSRVAGVATVMGFFLAVTMIILENS